MKRLTAFLVSLLLLASSSFGQLAQTGGGLPTPPAGGGGGGEVAYNAGIAEIFADEAANGTTGSVSPSGDNRAMFCGAASLNAFGGAPTITECRYGGSGGTALTKLGTDETFFSSNAGMAAFTIAPGPTGSTTVYGLWSGGIKAGVGATFYTGANQTTPFDGRATNTGGDGGPVTTTPGSVTVTGTSAGQIVVAFLAASSETSTGSCSAVAGTTIRAQATGGLLFICLLEKTASGSSTTLDVNVDQSSTGALTWTAIGAKVNAP